MDRNLGAIDRIGRIYIGLIAVIAGISALAGYWAVGAVIGGIAVVVGAILLVTGVSQKSPITSADLALMADDLAKIPYAVKLSKATRSNVRQNVVIAVLTVGLLLAGVLMSYSTSPAARSSTRAASSLSSRTASACCDTDRTHLSHHVIQ